MSPCQLQVGQLVKEAGWLVDWLAGWLVDRSGALGSGRAGGWAWQQAGEGVL